MLQVKYLSYHIHLFLNLKVNFSLSTGNGKVYAKQNLIYENNTPITAYITVTDDVIWIREKLRIDLTSTTIIYHVPSAMLSS